MGKIHYPGNNRIALIVPDGYSQFQAAETDSHKLCIPTVKNTLYDVPLAAPRGLDGVEMLYVLQIYLLAQQNG